jgi:1-acyl-sn-glycerol-3-phosphate acyltransferase
MPDPKKDEFFSLKYRIVRLFLVLLSFPFIKKINGTQNLLGDGPFIIAANHTSHIDWAFFYNRFSVITKKYVHCFATSKYHNVFLYRFYVNLSKSIWIDPKRPVQSMHAALAYLRRREIVAIFPEGTRSLDGKIKKAKAGVAALALQAHVPVVPVGLINAHKVLPKGAVFPHFTRCEANIGEPMNFEGFYKEHDEAVDQNDQDKIAEIEEKVARIIMKEIARLSNQEYPY